MGYHVIGVSKAVVDFDQIATPEQIIPHKSSFLGELATGRHREEKTARHKSRAVLFRSRPYCS